MIVISRRNLLLLGGAMLLDSPANRASAKPANRPTEQPSLVTATGLRCEYRDEPMGIDVVCPRLTWTVNGPRRGERQTAYQVLVASSPLKLTHDVGDLWDSGKVELAGDQHAEYCGKPLTSRTRCYWKVRVWDMFGQPSDWSVSSYWSMGLLNQSDWLADWIADSTLADPANRPWTPTHCYLSEISPVPDVQKWLVIDIGAQKAVDSILISPARSNDMFDQPTILFPVRFTVEAATSADFADAVQVVNCTAADVAPPRPTINPLKAYRFPKIQARYIRITVLRLPLWDGNDYAFALGRLKVFSGTEDVAAGALVTSSDSVESDLWSRRFLTDANAVVGRIPTPTILQPKIGSATSPSRVPVFRKEFNVPAKIDRATLRCAARGFYEPSINGRKVSDDVLLGGYTQYNRRVQYQTYDVTELIRPGANAIGVLVGYGWYAGHMNFRGNEYLSGYFPQFLAQLEIECAGGERIIVSSDGSWKSTLDGPVRWSDILDGEGYDCRAEITEWDGPHFDDRAWKPVTVIPRDGTPLIWQRAQPVSRMEEIRPISVQQTAAGKYVFDLGQEIAGWCRVTADGPAGRVVTVRHSEKRHSDGTIDVDNLWGVAAEEDYILDGKGPRPLEPRFTWHGFRFVEVSGLTQSPTLDSLVGIHVRTAVRQTGEFECSNPLYNSLMAAARWTQKNLLFDVPAGCAGRGERLAWTGDIRPCVHSALFHFDSAALFEKYAADMRADQTSDGRFTDICPQAFCEGTLSHTGSAGWADAGVSLPWQNYLHTGDRRILSDHYQSARRWVEYVSTNNPSFIWTLQQGMAWGDWLSPSTQTPLVIGATAFFAHNADILSQMAGILGLTDDRARYRELFQNIRSAFVTNFVSGDGVIQLSKGSDPEIRSDVQGSYALALHFELLDEPLRSLAVDRLLDVIARGGGHPETGFWSSVELLLALSGNGQHQTASTMMNLTTEPSWGGMVQGDGTTCWESFDADRRNLSLNHWTHSAISEWFYRNVAGIAPDPQHPGFKNVIIRPRPTSEVSSCKASYESVRGVVNVAWETDEQNLHLNVVVPPNMTASVYLPGDSVMQITEGGAPISKALNINTVSPQGGLICIPVESGSYSFVAKGPVQTL